MPDRDSVINDLVERIEATLAVDSEWVNMPLDLVQYALHLLKEQPTKAEIDGGGNTWYFVCGECHTYIDRRDKYCRECGRAIQWE